MNDVVLRYIVEEETTVRDVLINKFRISSRLLRKLKLNSRIYCNNEIARVRDKVFLGDVVLVNITFSETNDKIISQKKELDILYEDDSLLILNKTGDMVVHPTCIHQDGTLANFVKGYLELKNENVVTRFVNRLDRETSGVIIFAKNEYAQEQLSRQMATREFEKEYITVVHGSIEKEKGTIDLPIKRSPNSIMERITADDGETAITHYEVIKRFSDMTLVKVKLETGRTHQIRVHFKAIGHSVVGDGLYSDIETDLISRQALHAYKISFVHPITGKRIEVIANIPEDINNLISKKDVD